MADMNGTDHLVRQGAVEKGGYDNKGFHLPDKMKESPEGSDSGTMENGHPPSLAECVATTTLPNGHTLDPCSDLVLVNGLNGSAVLMLDDREHGKELIGENINLNTDSTKELKSPLDTRLHHFVPLESDGKLLNSEDTHIAIPEDAVINFNTGRIRRSPSSRSSEKIPLEQFAPSIEDLYEGSEKALEAQGQNGDPMSPDKMQQSNGTGVTFDEYFIPVNTHKKYLRGEKLYLTKDNRKLCEGWRRVIICGLIAIVIAVAVLVGVLAATGILLAESENKTIRHEPHGYHLPDRASISQVGHSFTSKPSLEVPHKDLPLTTVDVPSQTMSTILEAISPPEVNTKVPVLHNDSSHSHTIVPNALVGEFTIVDESFTDDLKDNTSYGFLSFATHLESELTRLFHQNGGDFETLKILNFRPGSIIVSFVVIWNSEHGIILAKQAYEIMKSHLKSNSFLFLAFQVDMNSLKFTDVVDECIFQKGGCSYECMWSYSTLAKTCICAENMKLMSDGKSCEEIRLSTTSTEAPKQEYSTLTTDDAGQSSSSTTALTQEVNTQLANTDLEDNSSTTTSLGPRKTSSLPTTTAFSLSDISLTVNASGESETQVVIMESTTDLLHDTRTTVKPFVDSSTTAIQTQADSTTSSYTEMQDFTSINAQVVATTATVLFFNGANISNETDSGPKVSTEMINSETSTGYETTSAATKFSTAISISNEGVFPASDNTETTTESITDFITFPTLSTISDETFDFASKQNVSTTESHMLPTTESKTTSDSFSVQETFSTSIPLINNSHRIPEVRSFDNITYDVFDINQSMAPNYTESSTKSPSETLSNLSTFTFETTQSSLFTKELIDASETILNQTVPEEVDLPTITTDHITMDTESPLVSQFTESETTIGPTFSSLGITGDIFVSLETENIHVNFSETESTTIFNNISTNLLNIELGNITGVTMIYKESNDTEDYEKITDGILITVPTVEVATSIHDNSTPERDDSNTTTIDYSYTTVTDDSNTTITVDNNINITDDSNTTIADNNNTLLMDASNTTVTDNHNTTLLDVSNTTITDDINITLTDDFNFTVTDDSDITFTDDGNTTVADYINTTVADYINTTLQDKSNTTVTDDSNTTITDDSNGALTNGSNTTVTDDSNTTVTVLGSITITDDSNTAVTDISSATVTNNNTSVTVDSNIPITDDNGTTVTDDGSISDVTTIGTGSISTISESVIFSPTSQPTSEDMRTFLSTQPDLTNYTSEVLTEAYSTLATDHTTPFYLNLNISSNSTEFPYETKEAFDDNITASDFSGNASNEFDGIFVTNWTLDMNATDFNSTFPEIELSTLSPYEMNSTLNFTMFGNFSTLEDYDLFNSTWNETAPNSTNGIDCKEDQFLCVTLNQCLNNTFLCDGIEDCPGGFDESDCDETCHLNFKCNSSACIMSEAHCDGIWDCDDGGDEKNCTITECAKHEVMCLDKSTCIKPGDICDWKYNCRDRSDEVGCVERTTCETGGRFFCNDGLCIPWSLKCDGDFDCKDKEDEGNCTCLEDEFRCNDGKCLKSSSRCDGHQDCHNAEDEMGCVKVDEQNVVFTYEPYSGNWAMLCAEDWTLDDGRYLCQELGFGHALSTEKYHVSFNGTWMAMKRENLTDTSFWTERVTFAESCNSNLAASVTCQKFDCGNYSGLLHRRRRQADSPSSPASQWPFIAYVSTFQSSKGCLSEILTPIWLVTSAECLLSIGKEPHNGSDWYVRTNVAKGLYSDLAQNHEVLKIIPHHHSSKFRSLILRDYDVALVRLKHSLVFSDKIGAICLPEEQVPSGITCFSGVLGTDQPRAPPPESLSISSSALMVMDRESCNLPDHFNGQVNQRMLCTRSSDKQKLCDNDVGTPLMCLSGPNNWYLAGILTYQRFCEIYGWHPAVFSNLFSMRKFIDLVTGQKQYEISYDSSIYIILPPTTPSPTEYMTTVTFSEATTNVEDASFFTSVSGTNVDEFTDAVTHLPSFVGDHDLYSDLNTTELNAETTTENTTDLELTTVLGEFSNTSEESRIDGIDQTEMTKSLGITVTDNFEYDSTMAPTVNQTFDTEFTHDKLINMTQEFSTLIKPAANESVFGTTSSTESSQIETITVSSINPNFSNLNVEDAHISETNLSTPLNTTDSFHSLISDAVISNATTQYLGYRSLEDMTDSPSTDSTHFFTDAEASEKTMLTTDLKDSLPVINESSRYEDVMLSDSGTPRNYQSSQLKRPTSSTENDSSFGITVSPTASELITFSELNSTIGAITETNLDLSTTSLTYTTAFHNSAGTVFPYTSEFTEGMLMNDSLIHVVGRDENQSNETMSSLENVNDTDLKQNDYVVNNTSIELPVKLLSLLESGVEKSTVIEINKEMEAMITTASSTIINTEKDIVLENSTEVKEEIAPTTELPIYSSTRELVERTKIVDNLNFFTTVIPSQDETLVTSSLDNTEITMLVVNNGEPVTHDLVYSTVLNNVPTTVDNVSESVTVEYKDGVLNLTENSQVMDIIANETSEFSFNVTSQEDFFSNGTGTCGDWDEDYNDTDDLVTDYNMTFKLWPSLGFLQMVSEPRLCASSTLSSHYVLTSLSCLLFRDNLLDPENWVLIGGLFDPTSSHPGTQYHVVEEIIPYPSKKKPLLFLENDLALIKIKDEIKMNKYLKAVCLPHEPVDPNQRCFTAGWSKTAIEEDHDKEFHSLSVNIVPSNKCNSSENYNGMLLESLTCINYSKENINPCQVDVGAPLLCINNEKHWEIQGILTFPSPCDNKQPAVYNSVNSVKEWITQIIFSNSTSV